MSTTSSEVARDRYVAVHGSTQFKALQRRSNTFIVWASAVFYGWWFLVVVLAAFFPKVLRQGLGGPLNVGLLFIFISLNLVVVLSGVYLRFARTQLDPLSEKIRADLEGDLR